MTISTFIALETTNGFMAGVTYEATRAKPYSSKRRSVWGFRPVGMPESCPILGNTDDVIGLLGAGVIKSLKAA